MHRGGGNGGGGGGSTGGSRTFSYIGLNSSSVSASMGGNITMANGANISTWYFSNGGGFNGDRTVPSPVFECTQGQTANLTLNSMMMSPHTIHLHGLDVDQANDGVPATSQAVTGSFTYTFTAPHAGTYMYHCHVDTHLHFEMGMYGTVIVRPSNGSTSQIWDNGPTFDKEYIWHLHTFDSTWHSGGGGMGGGGMGGGGSGAGLVRHNPNYFMLNGRDGSNSMSDSTVRVQAPAGKRVLIRLQNVAYQIANVRLGGLSFQVVASDGRPLEQAFNATSLTVAPGERFDIILTMPGSGTRTATVDYYHINGVRLLGSVATNITVG